MLQTLGTNVSSSYGLAAFTQKTGGVCELITSLCSDTSSEIKFSRETRAKQPAQIPSYIMMLHRMRSSGVEQQRRKQNTAECERRPAAGKEHAKDPANH